MSIFKKIFGSPNDRMIKKTTPVVAHINSLEPESIKLTDAELRQKTDKFKERLSAGETLDDILPEAFAVAREACRRVLDTPSPGTKSVKMRPFDVQLIGGIVLHTGDIAEMQTGEGKTLVATLPAYLNALTGQGVHIVTVNDYLAKRDMEWMSPMYEFLGISAGAIHGNQDNAEKSAAYDCDITYGTNNEFGFDYLRDNMRTSVETQVQKRLNYGIIDEVDSILIDEARTPLIISGPAEESTDKYYRADKIARQLKVDKDFEIKEKEKAAHLNESGIAETEKQLGVPSIYTEGYMDWPHYMEQALRAHHLFKKDRDYIVKGGEVVIVDEFTGRLMEGRAWSDGLHQAIQAKERIKIKEENQTLATITLQNFYRLYKKLAGMTGTAYTEAGEFHQIYGLEVVQIPTNKPMKRDVYPDSVYRTEKEKFNAIINEIEEIHKSGRPILVGTVSIEKSELLSDMLNKRGVKHEVLNAKQHEREASIVANAGQKGTVTIATNMAGRGTDIVLGEGVAALGGLHILGTDRHEARRIDNQLRGRAGRQGDPGSSKFYTSLEDDLMRLFASERVSSILKKFGMDEGMAIEHPMISKSIERAQKKVEQHNFEIRKHLLEYDEVMDQQRKSIYTLRQRILEHDNIRNDIKEMIENTILDSLYSYFNSKTYDDDWDIAGLSNWFKLKFDRDFKIGEDTEQTRDEIGDSLIEIGIKAYEDKEKELGEQNMRMLEQVLLLNKIDMKWKDHLYAMDHLKSGIGLRGYAQVDPKVEYKREALQMFETMQCSIREEITDLIFKVRISERTEGQTRNVLREESFVYQDFDRLENAKEKAIANSETKEKKLEPVRASAKVGRNQPCPCGSKRKYKQCCGK
ncbi:MAG: preprotein translocase subunit SecA [Candidatus Anammoxibacter sp.]